MTENVQLTFRGYPASDPIELTSRPGWAMTNTYVLHSATVIDSACEGIEAFDAWLAAPDSRVVALPVRTREELYVTRTEDYAFSEFGGIDREYVRRTWTPLKTQQGILVPAEQVAGWGGNVISQYGGTAKIHQSDADLLLDHIVPDDDVMRPEHLFMRARPFARDTWDRSRQVFISVWLRVLFKPVVSPPTPTRS